MRLILPILDKERGRYGMKESKLSKYYVKILNLSKDSEDGQKILCWKLNENNPFAGDFSGSFQFFYLFIYLKIVQI
jgi:DNA ligase 4